MQKMGISIIVVSIVTYGFIFSRKGSSQYFIISDITEQTDFGGPSHPDSLGGHGVMWSDIDNNGYPDLYITMNWKYNIHYSELFYFNNGRYRFTESAKQIGIADIDGGSHGAVFADLDNDGGYDLINGSTVSFEGGPVSNNVYENV